MGTADVKSDAGRGASSRDNKGILKLPTVASVRQIDPWVQVSIDNVRIGGDAGSPTPRIAAQQISTRARETVGARHAHSWIRPHETQPEHGIFRIHPYAFGARNLGHQNDFSRR